MPKLTNIFSSGKMDKDIAESLMKQDGYAHAENLRFHINDGNDGIAVNIKGTTMISDATAGNTDLKCIGAYFNENKDAIYYLLASANGAISKIVEYDINLNTTTVIAEDNASILKFNKAGYITGINELNGLLFISEWGNNPRRINIERAKAYGLNGFTEDDIMLLVKPPMQKLKLTLQTTASEDENYIKEIFLSFSYRYRYLDGEYSVLAPFTEFAFEPKEFEYDYSTQSNLSMVNKFNQVLIEFNTGNERVTEIQLVFKESGSNTEWIIDDFNKSVMGYGHNETKSFVFNNSKVKRALSDNVLAGTQDNVPRTNKAQTIIDGRLILAHYKEFYDIKDNLGAQIEIDYSLEAISLPNTKLVEGIEVPSLLPKKTAKSNRDYEVVMVYDDGYGRVTTSLESKTNTLFIETAKCVTENSIDVILKHKPPFWAKYYRFFIRQSKKDYEQILPSLFYQEGEFRWVKLEGADKDKVREGDYLIVKSDSQNILTTLVKTKVLEIKAQEKNFLQPEDVTSKITERSGLYFKIKPKNFRLNTDDFENFELSTYHNSKDRYNNSLTNSAYNVGTAYYYGDSDLDDMVSGWNGVDVLAQNIDKHFMVQISSLGDGTTTFNQFRWNTDGGAFSAETVINVGVAQPLSDGVTVTFASNTGHDITDEWSIYARGNLRSNDKRAYGFFRTVGDKYVTMTQAGHTVDDEIIENGANITLTYDEYGAGDTYFELNLISSRKYANIQEWYFGDNVGQQILNVIPSFELSRIYFSRGVIRKDNDGNANYLEYNADGYMTMVTESQMSQPTNVSFNQIVKMSAKTTSFQSNGITRLIFETDPKETPKELFYEIGKTYDITGGFHIADSTIPTDVNQSAGVNLRVKLDWFNAYSYGNAVESYKIKDEFNRKSLAEGIRTSTTQKEQYKEVTRVADITWSDVYNEESTFNGLSTFNLSMANFVTLDKENASIQKLHNANGDLMVFQEDAIGIMPYNKNIIYSSEGDAVVGISTNILNKESYRPYSSGENGISLNPEGFVSVGNRKYLPHRVGGNILRLSTDGITEINENGLEYFSSEEMKANKGQAMVAGYDPKHQEYLIYLPNIGMTLAFKEKAGGFPTFYTFQPDFLLGADNELYGWKNGKMYILNNSEIRNNFFGVQYDSKIKFFVNHSFGVKKVFKAITLKSTHAWFANIATKLTSRDIQKNSFTKIEDYWHSEIMGNTNTNILSNSIFGLGSYAIVNGDIFCKKGSVMSIGDYVTSNTLTFAQNKIVDILDDRIVLENKITTAVSFLMYSKNQNIDGGDIRGDVMSVELINDAYEEVKIESVSVEVSESEVN